MVRKNQTVTFNKSPETTTSIFAPQKIMNVILMFLLMRYILQFPPVEGAIIENSNIREMAFHYMSRRSVNWDAKPSQPETEKTRKH